MTVLPELSFLLATDRQTGEGRAAATVRKTGIMSQAQVKVAERWTKKGQTGSTGAGIRQST